MTTIDPKYFPLVAAIITAIGIVISACVAIGIHWHSGRRAKRQQLQATQLVLLAARSKFVAALAEVHNALKRPTGNYSFVGQSIGAHDTAIAEFRQHLPNERRLSFDIDCKTYRDCRETVKNGNVFGQVTDKARADLMEAIEILLTYAE